MGYFCFKIPDCSDGILIAGWQAGFVRGTKTEIKKRTGFRKHL